MSKQMETRRRSMILVVLIACLAIVGRVDAAASYWNLPAAPGALAAYGYAYGLLLHDDGTATRYLAEYRPYPGSVDEPEIAVVVLVKGGADVPFAAVEATRLRGPDGSEVAGRRVAPSETRRFNDVLFPEISRAQPSFARLIRVHQLYYANGRHFEPTSFYRERLRYAKAEAHEQPLLVLTWERASAAEPFSPTSGLRTGATVDGFPVTIAEATRGRGAMAARVAGDPATGAAPAPAAARASGSLITRGIAAEQAVRSLYTGDFANVGFERGDLRFATLLHQYLYAYGRRCAAQLPANKVEITKSKCAEERVTTQGGIEINRSCSRYETVRTGVYADPDLYAAANSKQAVQAQAVGAMQEALRMLQPRSGASGTDVSAIADQAARDMKALVSMNACDGAGLERFQENLRRFALGEAALR